MVGLAGIHDQLAVRQNEAHNLWAYPEMPSNGQPVDYQAAAAVLEANWRPGDVIAYEVDDSNHYQVDTSVAYYLRGKPVPPTVFQAQTQVQANSLQPIECIDPSVCITGTPRIWVIYVPHLDPDPFSALPGAEGGLVETLGYQVDDAVPAERHHGGPAQHRAGKRLTTAGPAQGTARRGAGGLAARSRSVSAYPAHSW